MKITIDTSIDKPDEIQKMCQFLLELTNTSNKEYTNSPTVSSVDATNMMSMFGESEPTPSLQSQNPLDRAPDFGAFLSLTKNYEKKEQVSRPQIEFL